MLTLQLVLSGISEAQLMFLWDVCVPGKLDTLSAVWYFGTWFDVGCSICDPQSTRASTGQVIQPLSQKPLLIDCRLNPLGSEALFSALLFCGAGERQNSVPVLCSTCIISWVLPADVESTLCVQTVQAVNRNSHWKPLEAAIVAVVIIVGRESRPVSLWWVGWVLRRAIQLLKT